MLNVMHVFAGQQECNPDLKMYSNGTEMRCPDETGKIVVPILLAFYMLLTNVLLLNLLIAMFRYVVLGYLP